MFIFRDLGTLEKVEEAPWTCYALDPKQRKEMSAAWTSLEKFRIETVAGWTLAPDVKPRVLLKLAANMKSLLRCKERGTERQDEDVDKDMRLIKRSFSPTRSPAELLKAGLTKVKSQLHYEKKRTNGTSREDDNDDDKLPLIRKSPKIPAVHTIHPLVLAGLIL